jgi:hypothetical protein
MSTDPRRRRAELHDALDRVLAELSPDEWPFGLGVSVACGKERLICSWVDGATAIRKDVLTDPDAVRRAFDTGSVNVTSGDVTS